MKKISSYMALSAALLFVLSPVSAFAKTNGNGNGVQNQVRTRARTQVKATVCPTNAFGHLIAPGWIKKNGATSVPLGCALPAGIAKILGYTMTIASSTSTTSPAISALVITPGTTTATVTWNTDKSSDSAVFFSTTTPVNTSVTATQVVYSPTYMTMHSLTLTNLTPSTTYYVVVRSRDLINNVTTLSPVSFTTNAVSDTTAPTLSNVVSVVGTSTLKFLWNTSELASSKVFFSTSSPVNVTATTTPFTEDTSLVLSHSATVTGLTPNTLYHIVLQSKDSAGNVGSVQEFPITTSQ